MKKILEYVQLADMYLMRLEKLVIYMVLFIMVTMAFGQVVVRNLFQMGFMWVDQVVKVTVIWSTFVGASLTTYYGRHISVDLIAQYTGGRMRTLIDFVTILIVGVVSGFLFLTAVDYLGILSEYNVSQIVEGVPDWIVMLAVPYFFFITSVRMLIAILTLEKRGDASV